MSLFDKQKSLQFGREYGDDQQRWRSTSSGYANTDEEHADDLHELMDDNIKSREERSAASMQQEQDVVDITAQGDRQVGSDVDFGQDVLVDEEGSRGSAVNSQDPLVTLDHSKHIILIVDDDYDTRTMYSTIFGNSGFNVVEASDGLEGLDLATKHQPDVIFTGIIMPRMDGFTMIEALQKNATLADTPIVINSHLGRTQDKERAKELGIRDFIVRDYTAPREVVDRIKALLMTMEYTIPFDVDASYAQELLADIGGVEAFACKNPVMKLRLSNAQEKTFTAKLVCED